MKTSIKCALSLTFAWSGANAQSLEARVAAASGTVGFEYPTRPDVCGAGGRNGISISRGNTIHDGRCEHGPAHAVVVRNGGTVSGITITVGIMYTRASTELDAVSAAEAANYFLAIAPSLANEPADKAIMGAAIADAPLNWRRMIEIARDNRASEGARKSSLFWVGQEASDAATAGLSAVANDEDAQSDVRSNALFFLAQRKDGEGVPGLIRVAKESKSIKLRKDAIWHLAQSRDPRAIAVFEQLLAGR